MFQFTRFASLSYVFTQRYPCGWVSPFRYLGINAYLPAPPSFSQAITSFVAYHRQGIHHMLLVTWPYNFDVSCETSPFLFKDLQGLSPCALCRNQLNPFGPSSYYFWISKLGLNIRFDAIKNFMLLMARSAGFILAVSISNSDSTLWIFKEQPIDRTISINNKVAFFKATLVLNHV